MICGRFTLIVICSALTANLDDNISWATESSALEISTAQPPSTRVIPNQSNSQLKIYSDRITSPLDRAIREGTLERGSQKMSPVPTNSSVDTADVPSAKPINKLWFVAAMAVTLSLSLFLLRILFQRPVAKPETVKKLAAASESPELIESEVKAHVAEMPVTVSSPIPSLHANNSQPPKKVRETPPFKDGADSNFVSTEPQVQSRAEQLPASDSLVAINSGENYIDIVAELIQDLKQSDRNIRRKAIWELAKLGDSRVMEPLMAIMPQASPVDKSLMIKAIKQITHRSVEPVNKRLFALLNDQNPQVRVNAILDLANFYQFVIPVTQRLEQMQFDENLEVKLEAIKALNNLTQGYAVALHQDHAENQVSEVTVRDKDQTS